MKNINSSHYKKGHIPWSKGKKLPHSLEHRRKISETLKRKKISPQLYYTEFTKKHREKLSKNNRHWIDGRSLIQYPSEFGKPLKNIVRKRDNYQCQICFRYENEIIKEHGKCLHIHHKDSNKNNNN